MAVKWLIPVLVPASSFKLSIEYSVNGKMLHVFAFTAAKLRGSDPEATYMELMYCNPLVQD